MSKELCLYTTVSELFIVVEELLCVASEGDCLNGKSLTSTTLNSFENFGQEVNTKH